MEKRRRRDQDGEIGKGDKNTILVVLVLDERVQERLGLCGPGLDLALVGGRVAGATDGRDDSERAATESGWGKGGHT